MFGCSYRGMPETTAPVRNMIGANMSFRRDGAARGRAASARRWAGRASGRSATEETDAVHPRAAAQPGRHHPARTRRPRAAPRPAARANWAYFRSRCYGRGRLEGAAVALGRIARRPVRRVAPHAAHPAARRRARSARCRRGRRRVGSRAGRGHRRRLRRHRYGIRASRSSARHRGSAPLVRVHATERSRECTTARTSPPPGGHPALPAAHRRSGAPRARGRAQVCATGWTSRVLTTDTTGELPPEEVIDGVRVLRVPAWPSRAGLPRGARDLHPLVASGGWDLVHLQSYHTAVAPLAMARRGAATRPVRRHLPRRRALVAPPHAAARARSARMLRPLSRTRRAARSRRGVRGPRSSRRELRIPRDRFVVIPNGSDLPAPAALRASSPTPARSSSPPSAGSNATRDTTASIAAMPHVLEREPDAELQIIGSGPYGDALRRLAERARRGRQGDDPLDPGLGPRRRWPRTLARLGAHGADERVRDASPVGRRGGRAGDARARRRHLRPSRARRARPRHRRARSSRTPAAVADAIVRELREPRPVPRIDLPTLGRLRRSARGPLPRRRRRTPPSARSRCAAGRRDERDGVSPRGRLREPSGPDERTRGAPSRRSCASRSA